jgi:hypothetical protein
MYTWPIAAARVSHNSSETNHGGAASPNKNDGGAASSRKVDPDFVSRPATGVTSSSSTPRSEEPANVASKDLPKPPPPRPLQEDSLQKSPSPVSSAKVSSLPPPSLSAAVLLCHLIDCSPEEQEAVVEDELPDLVAPYSQTNVGSTSTSTSTTIATTDDEALEEEATTTSTRTDLSSETTLEETAKKPAIRRRRGGGGRSSNTVSFGNAHIREFPVVMGDNPSVLFGGPPLRLGYDEASGGSEEDAEYIMSVDDYEKRRAPHRRPATQLRVPPNVRREWVGYHPELERQVYYQQRARIHSVASAEYDEWNYLLECAVRGVTKRVRRLGLHSHSSHPHQPQNQQQPATNEASAHEWIRLHKQAKQRMQEYQKLQEQERLQERQQQRLRHVAQEKQRSPKHIE